MVKNIRISKQCYQYDALANSWTEFALLGESRQYMASSVIEGKLLASGGTSDVSQVESTLDSTEYLDKKESRGEFKPGSNMPMKMHSHCQVTVNSTHVFISDVRDTGSTYLLNWNSQDFTTMPQLQRHRWNPACGLSWSQERGMEIVVAGLFVRGAWQEKHGTSDIFSLSSQAWREGPEFDVEGHALVGTQAVQIGNSFALVGGWYYDCYSTQVLRYDPEQEVFVILNVTLKAARAFHTAVHVPNAEAIFNCTSQ